MFECVLKQDTNTNTDIVFECVLQILGVGKRHSMTSMKVPKRILVANSSKGLDSAGSLNLNLTPSGSHHAASPCNLESELMVSDENWVHNRDSPGRPSPPHNIRKVHFLLHLYIYFHIL